MSMGLYLLAGIVFLLFIIFIVDLVRDGRSETRNRPRNFNQINRYSEEFGEDDFIDYDDYRYFGLDDADDLDYEDGNMDLYNSRHNIQEDDEFRMNFDKIDQLYGNEFGHDITEDVKDQPEANSKDHKHYD